MNGHDERNIKRILYFADALSETLGLRGITPELVKSDSYTQWAVTTPLYNIGELTTHLSHDLRDAHPEIPWSKIAGLRHRLVHDYEGTNWNIVVGVLFEDLPIFARQVRNLLENSLLS